MRSYRGAFYRWTGTHWREYADEKIAAALYDFLGQAIAVGKKGDVGPYNPTRSKVDNVVHALRHLVLVNQDRETPCWLDRRKGQPPRDLVACRNGILNLKTRELLPHDPQFFTMNCMPLKYNPDALWSKRWLKFLEELWPTTAQDDKTRKANEVAQECLHEIVGYASNGRYQPAKDLSHCRSEARRQGHHRLGAAAVAWSRKMSWPRR